MTPEVLVIAAVRIAGSLPVLRWPLAGAVLALVVDLSDLLLRDVLDLGGIPDYQALDKWLDQVYMAVFLVVAWRWTGADRAVAVGLYLFRLVGFALFEVTGDRAVLLLFPNVFEFWFLLVLVVRRWWPGYTWRPASLALALAVLTGFKELHEWALHGGRIFDGISSLDFIDLVRRWLTGGP